MMLAGAAAVGGLAAVTARHEFKKQLTKLVVKALSEFFEVDPKQIKSNLLTDTKIELRHMRLKPIALFQNCELTGELDLVEFQWSWGGSKDGATAYVRKTVLLIQGARFRLVQTNNEPMNVETQESMEHDSDDDEDGSSELPKNVQQIIDYLNIQITDLHFTIEGTQSEGQEPQSAVLEIKSMELKSLGRDHITPAKHNADEEPPPPPLSQHIELKGASLYVFTPDNRLYIVEPFGYKASVKRVTGRRFLDGLETGLEVVGENHLESDLVFHAGVTQIQTLVKIQNIIGSTDDSTKEVAKDKEEVLVDKTEIVPEKDNDSAPPSTIFLLPFPSIKIILPNKATIHTPFWCFIMSVDGKQQYLEVTGGIQINEGKYPFVTFGSTAKLIIDFFGNSVVLQQLPAEAMNDDTKPLARVQWEEVGVQRVRDGVDRVIALLASQSKDDEKQETTDVTRDETVASHSNIWSLVMNGIISLRMEGGDDWIEAALHDITFVSGNHPGGLPSQIKVGGAVFGPTSFGDISFRIGAITFTTDLLHSVSTTPIKDVQKFVMRVLRLAE